MKLLLFLSLLVGTSFSQSPKDQVSNPVDDYFKGYEDVFVDINNISHTFPQEVRKVGFPVTLLHIHSNGKGVLVFNSDYTESTYKKNLTDVYPCSWHLDKKANIPKAYEFCANEQDYNSDDIQKRLEKIHEMGYQHYGTTIRPIRGNITEYETDNGHVYLASDIPNDPNIFISETSVHGSKYDDCEYREKCFNQGVGPLPGPHHIRRLGHEDDKLDIKK